MRDEEREERDRGFFFFKQHKNTSWNKTHMGQCQKLEKESGYTLI